jgi:hypothetical protein
MEKYIRGMSASRANNNYDLHKFNVIKDTLDRGENPIGLTYHSSACTSTITTHDVFNYYRFKNKEYDLVISGGMSNGRLRKGSTKKSKQSSKQSKETGTRDTGKDKITG